MDAGAGNVVLTEMRNIRLRARSHIALWTVFSLCFLLAFHRAGAWRRNGPGFHLPIRVSQFTTVSWTRTKCASCHANQAAAFAKSNHAKAMAIASDKSVRANFNNTSFEHNGLVSTFFRQDKRFFVRTEGPDGKQAEFEVKYTFAYEPLQQYLADIGGGRLQALDLAWDTEKQQWFWLGDGKPAKPGSTFHWTGPFYRWNRTCIDCHSTDSRANFQPETNEYKSSYVATSIGCQSCHGAGAKHVAWAEEKSRDAKMSTPSNLGLSKVDASACFACHARRTKLLDGYQPGKPFLDYFSPALLRPDLYFPDGQILDEVFEYGSFQQSKMARAGVTCLDCHTQHEAALKAQGNALCTQCHTKSAPERFVKYNPRRRLRHPRPYASPGGVHRSAVCQLPYARAYLYEGRPTARSLLRHSAS